MPIRVALVDDHKLLRDGIKRAIPSQEIVCVAEASTGRAAIDICDRRSDVDVLVLDSDLPDFQALDLVDEIHRLYPHIPCVVVLNSPDDQQVIPLLKTGGVKGIIVKTDSMDLVFHAVCQVHRGNTFFSSSISHILLSAVRNQTPQNRHNILSMRETQVVRLIAQGMTSKEIGSFLHITAETVRGHRSIILKKLRARNVAQMLVSAAELGLIPKLRDKES